MTNHVTYLETGSLDPAYNLAFEEFVLANRTKGDYLLLWQNDNTVVIGRNQNAEGEINRAFVDAHQVRVIRRMTGGGAVYHDLGNLNYSFITDADQSALRQRGHFVDPVVQALCGLGALAEASGRNDILVNGKKVSGTAQRILGNRILHHGTLLFDSNQDMVAGALQVSPDKFQTKGIQSVRSRIGNIRACLAQDMTLPAFWSYLKSALAGTAGMVQGQLAAEEFAQIEETKRLKYDTYAWTFGRSFPYSVTNRRRWAGGSLKVCIAVEEGKIAHIDFFGDFLALRPLEQVTEALCGCLFRRDSVACILARVPIADYFGGISPDEVLDTMFGMDETATTAQTM